MKNECDADPNNGLGDPLDFVRGTRQMLAGSSWNGVGLLTAYLDSHPLMAELQAALAENDIRVKGGAGWNASGSARGDVMIGHGAGDVLYGNGGGDILLGGEGDQSRRRRRPERSGEQGERSAFRRAASDAVLVLRRVG
ncbi:MAG: hypothetical protein M0Q22_04445 [Sulfuritalea sp.]|jgi:hypothetical protein|nr:hypothetical protein [Sulfuritalea sp.]